jgi:hypothetical protein
MNKDSHLLFEAYKKINEKFEFFGCSSKSEDNESHDGDESCKDSDCTCGGCPMCTEEYRKTGKLPKDFKKEEDSEESKKPKHSKAHYEGAVKVAHHILQGKHKDEELKEKILAHLRKIYGEDFDEGKAEKEVKKILGSKAKSEGNEDNMKCTGKPDCKCDECMDHDKEMM